MGSSSRRFCDASLFAWVARVVCLKSRAGATVWSEGVIAQVVAAPFQTREQRYIMKFVGVLLVTAMVGAGAMGCSSGADKGTPSGETAGDKTSQLVSSADGGKVSLGAVKLSIPAGALSEDTTITVESKAVPGSAPEKASIHGLIYDFGPDGTMFEKPVELTLPLVAKPGDKETAVVSWLDATSNVWKDVDTEISGDSVVASIQHFTMYVVRFKGVEALDCSFVACGGDIVGDWSISGGCVDDGGNNGLNELCATATIDVDFDTTGTVSFGADGKFSSNVASSGSLALNLPKECLPALGGSCEDFSSALDSPCTTAADGSCACIIPADDNTAGDMGTYSVSGTSLTMTSTSSIAPDELEYCVEGNNLHVKQTKDGTTSVYVATRK